MRIGSKISLLPENWRTVKQLSHATDFIEVYYTKERIELKKLLSLNTRWVVHGPHAAHGFNVATGSNMEFFKESVVFANKIGAKYVIIHPGHCKKGKKEAVFDAMIDNMKQLKTFSKQHDIKLLIENTIPFVYMGMKILPFFKGMEFIGSVPKEMKKILRRVKGEFVLDFAHSCITSVNLNIGYKKIIKDFMKLKPRMFHISDGIMNKKRDMHLPLGRGNYDIPFLISNIKNHDVTMEIKPSTLENFIDSRNYIEKILKG